MSVLHARVPEPVWADRRAEAEAYHEMDHTAVNRQFVSDLLAGGAVGPDVFDIGAGTALISVEMCRQDAELRVLAVDAEIEMLEIARHVIEAAGMVERVTPALGDLVSLDDFEADSADTVVSNTVLHHLDCPRDFFPAILRVLKPGGRLFVRDLIRPADEAELRSLVAIHCDGQSDAASKMFEDSLRAALTIDEIRQLATDHRILPDAIDRTSDRHWTLDWTLDANGEV